MTLFVDGIYITQGLPFQFTDSYLQGIYANFLCYHPDVVQPQDCNIFVGPIIFLYGVKGHLGQCLFTGIAI